VLFDYFLYPPILGVIGLLIAIHLLLAPWSSCAASTRCSACSPPCCWWALCLPGHEDRIAFVRRCAVSSALAGFIGMFAATKANVRTTVAAHTTARRRP
jgi:hypothetical protein